MDFLRAHKFSMASIAISSGGFVFVFAAVFYFRHEGAWRPYMRSYQIVTAAGGLCLVVSFITALAALIRERSKLAVLAFLVSLFNFFLYAR
jgi:hypothetical protein